MTAEEWSRPASSRRLSATPGAGLTPRLWAHLLGSVFQGETKKARLQLAPLRHDPRSGRTVLARRLVVRLDFAGTEAGSGPWADPGGFARPVASLSPGRRRGGARGQGPRPLSGPLRGRLRPRPPRRQRAQPSPFPPRPGGSLPPRARPRPVWPRLAALLPERGRGAQSSGRGGLRAPPGPGRFADERGLRRPVRSPPPSTSQTLREEENHFYQSALLEAPDLWLWDLLVSPATKTYSFEVDQLSSSSTSSSLRVVLQGASDFEELDHHVRFSLNGIPVGEATWDGKVEQVFEAEVGAGVLGGSEQPRPGERRGRGSGLLHGLPESLRGRLPAAPVTSGGVLRGRFEQSGRTEVTGLTGRGFVVDETSPAWLKDTAARAVRPCLPRRGRPSYLAVSEGSLLAPEVRAVLLPPRSRSNRAEWVLLSPREFLPAAQPLLELRRSQGLLAEAIALEDVYSEFGFGEKSARAIREFLSFAFHTWKTPPRYVLLLGDSNLRPKDHLRTGVADRVPSAILADLLPVDRLRSRPRRRKRRGPRSPTSPSAA